MTDHRFDFDNFFDDDYLYFYAPRLNDAASENEIDLITRLLEIDDSTTILDVACGHGRIANRLAARGYATTGLDASPLFLAVAEHHAEECGAHVDYVQGDMRDLPWQGTFDRALLWFSSFGYFADEDNRRVLGSVATALRPGGRLLLDLHNRDYILANYQAVRVLERGDDLMIDRSQYDPETGCSMMRRTVLRAGKVRHIPYFIRLFTYTELRDWLKFAGFRDVRGYGDGGGPLTLASHRMLVVATR